MTMFYSAAVSGKIACISLNRNMKTSQELVSARCGIISILSDVPGVTKSLERSVLTRRNMTLPYQGFTTVKNLA